MSPWEVLGVSPGATPEEVRAAYARQLKLHRPDTDPAGFRMVRDAYEALRRLGAGPMPPPWLQLGMGGGANSRVENDASSRNAPGPHEAAVDGVEGCGLDQDSDPATDQDGSKKSPQPFSSTRTRRAPLRACRDQRLRRALGRARASGRVPAVSRVLRALVQSWRRGDEPRGAIVQLLAEELLAAGPLLRKLLSPDDAALAAAAGDGDVAERLLLAHASVGDEDTVKRVSTALVSAALARPSPALAAVCARCAMAVALLDPKQAEQLADTAFPLLDQTWRMWLGELETWIQAGKEVRRAPLSERVSMQRLLRGGDQSADPADVVTALRLFSRLHGAAPVLATLFLDRFPQHRKALIRRGGNVTRATGQQSARPRRKRSHSGWSFWIWWMVFYGVVRAAYRVYASTQQ